MVKPLRGNLRLGAATSPRSDLLCDEVGIDDPWAAFGMDGSVSHVRPELTSWGGSVPHRSALIGLAEEGLGIRMRHW